jgi:hypothetical protein
MATTIKIIDAIFTSQPRTDVRRAEVHAIDFGAQRPTVTRNFSS